MQALVSAVLNLRIRLPVLVRHPSMETMHLTKEKSVNSETPCCCSHVCWIQGRIPPAHCDCHTNQSDLRRVTEHNSKA
jgi:hypothetical protein